MSQRRAEWGRQFLSGRLSRLCAHRQDAWAGHEGQKGAAVPRADTK